jgi:hypothetical protein
MRVPIGQNLDGGSAGDLDVARVSTEKFVLVAASRDSFGAVPAVAPMAGVPHCLNGFPSGEVAPRSVRGRFSGS